MKKLNKFQFEKTLKASRAYLLFTSGKHNFIREYYLKIESTNLNSSLFKVKLPKLPHHIKKQFIIKSGKL